MEKGEFIGREALEKAKADGIKRTLVGLESVDRGIPRDGYKVIGPERQGDWLRDQRFLCAVPEEEHRAGLCAGRAVGRSDTKWRSRCRSQPVKCKVVPTPFYKRPKKQS